MNARKKILLPIMLTALVSAALLTAIPKIHAQGTELLILPATNTYYYNVDPPYSTFLVNVSVSEVINLFSWQVRFAYDPAILEFVDTSLPTDHVFAGKNFLPAGPIPETGAFVYGASLAPGEVAFNGSGTLFQVELNITAPTSLPVSCDLELTGQGDDTFMLDNIGLDIEFTIVNSSFEYTLLEHVLHTVTIGTTDYIVETYSNASIAPNSIVTNMTERSMRFNVTGLFDNAAFVNITIPKAMMTNVSEVFVNNVDVNSTVTHTSNATHYFIYATFAYSDNTPVRIKTIIPEIATIVVMTFLVMSSAVAVVAKTKIRKK